LAPDALFNAALYREQLKQYNTALKNYQQHEKLYPTSKDLETVRFSQALVLEKQQNIGQAIAAFKAFATTYGRKSAKTAESYYRMGQLQEKINQRTNAKASYQAAVTVFKRQGMISESANHYAAKARFELLEPTFEQYRSLQLVMPQRVLERNLQQKFDMIRTLKKEYLQIVKMNDPEVSVAALSRLGLAYQDLSAGLFAAPLPTNLTPEEIQLYQSELQNQALPLEQQAIEAFETALSKSHELNVYTQATKDAYKQLSQYKPNDYPSVRFPLILQTYRVEPWSTDFEGGRK
jgi:tetratricopeptide (TPR) repeat protein